MCGSVQRQEVSANAHSLSEGFMVYHHSLLTGFGRNRWDVYYKGVVTGLRLSLNNYQLQSMLLSEWPLTFLWISTGGKRTLL